MFVTSSAIQNGAFEDKYGKRGTIYPKWYANLLYSI